MMFVLGYGEAQNLLSDGKNDAHTIVGKGSETGRRVPWSKKRPSSGKKLKSFKLEQVIVTLAAGLEAYGEVGTVHIQNVVYSVSE